MKRLRLATGIMLLIIISFLGFVRDKYLIYVNHEKVPALNSRTGEERYRMPVSIDDVSASVAGNPKWISSIAYTLLYMGLSAACIWLLFHDKNNVWITAGVHIVLAIIASVIILTGLLLNTFRPFYLSAEYIKNLIQSPLLTLILIAGFLVVKRNKPHT